VDEAMLQEMAMQGMMGPAGPPMGGGMPPAGPPPGDPMAGGGEGLVTIEVPEFALPMIAELLSSLIGGGPGAAAAEATAPMPPMM
jgi:hypothetical protein